MSSGAVSSLLTALYLADPDAISVTFTTIALVDAGDHKVYQAAWGSRRWDNRETLTIKKNGTTVTSGFTVDHLSGKVTFASANLVGDAITASGKKLTLIEVADLRGIQFEGSTKMLGPSETIRDAFEQYLPGKKNWKLSTDLWFVDGTYWEYLAAGRLVAEIFYQYDSSVKKCLVGYAQIDGVNWSVPQDGLQTSKITLQGSEGLVWDTK